MNLIYQAFWISSLIIEYRSNRYNTDKDLIIPDEIFKIQAQGLLLVFFLKRRQLQKSHV